MADPQGRPTIPRKPHPIRGCAHFLSFPVFGKIEVPKLCGAPTVGEYAVDGGRSPRCENHHPGEKNWFYYDSPSEECLVPLTNSEILAIVEALTRTFGFSTAGIEGALRDRLAALLTKKEPTDG